MSGPLPIACYVGQVGVSTSTLPIDIMILGDATMTTAMPVGARIAVFVRLLFVAVLAAITAPSASQSTWSGGQCPAQEWPNEFVCSEQLSITAIPPSVFNNDARLESVYGCPQPNLIQHPVSPTCMVSLWGSGWDRTPEAMSARRGDQVPGPFPLPLVAMLPTRRATPGIWRTTASRQFPLACSSPPPTFGSCTGIRPLAPPGPMPLNTHPCQHLDITRHMLERFVAGQTSARLIGGAPRVAATSNELPTPYA